jgi:hypothetical protein
MALQMNGASQRTIIRVNVVGEIKTQSITFNFDTINVMQRPNKATTAKE